MTETVFTSPMFYYVWLAGLALAVSSGILLYWLGRSMKGGMLGSAFYWVSFAYLVWALSHVVGTLHHPGELSLTLLVSFLALLGGGIMATYRSEFGSCYCTFSLA